MTAVSVRRLFHCCVSAAQYSRAAPKLNCPEATHHHITTCIQENRPISKSMWCIENPFVALQISKMAKQNRHIACWDY